MFLPTTHKSSLSSTWVEIIYAWPSISVWVTEQHLKWGSSLPQHCKPECKHSYTLSMWLKVLVPCWIPRKDTIRTHVMARKSSGRFWASSHPSSLDHCPYMHPGCAPGMLFLCWAASLPSSPFPRTHYASVILLPQRPGAISSHPPS